MLAVMNPVWPEVTSWTIVSKPVLAVQIIGNRSFRSRSLDAEAVDVQRNRVLRGRVARYPTWRIKLQLQKRATRVPADVTRRMWISAVVDVVIRIWFAFMREEGKRLRVAQCQAVPKGGVELKIPNGWAARPVRVRIGWEGRWIGRKHQSRHIVVARSFYVGVEEQRRLIVSNIFALVFGIETLVVLSLRTKREWLLTDEPINPRLRESLLSGQQADQQNRE